MPLDDDILAACQPLLDDLATQSLASLAEFDFSSLRDMPRRRRRSFNQRDISRALRAAKAAGFLVRVEIEPDGRIVLVPVSSMEAASEFDADDIVARLK